MAEFDGIVEQTVDPSPPFAALASWREPYELLDRVAETLGVPIAAVRSFTSADVALLRQADRLLRGKVVYADGGGELNLVATEDIREQLAAGANRRGEFGITQHRPDWPVELSFGAIDLGPVWVQVHADFAFRRRSRRYLTGTASECRSRQVYVSACLRNHRRATPNTPIDRLV
ncbi:MAG TPA: hypothetical protein VHR55_10945 [Candidatus Limnocylindria bacterium]|nr:hypothetical protein [Candidatus Limnocylindria bacterium]